MSVHSDNYSAAHFIDFDAGFAIPNAFSRHSTHLLCPSRSGPKYDKALQWGIPVVDMTWLTDVATTGVIASSSGSKPVTIEAPALDEKGKGKARVDEPVGQAKAQTMNDITNSASVAMTRCGWD